YGRFVVKRKTHSKRLTTKLNALRQEAKRRMRTPVSDQHRWLCQVLRGQCAYYGLPSNFRCLMGFPLDQTCLVQCTETSQPAATQLGNLRGFARAFLPSASTDHSSLRGVTTVSGLPSGRGVCGASACTDLRGQKPNGFATRPTCAILLPKMRK